MGILNIFGLNKRPKELVKSAQVTLYPTKITVETFHRVKAGFYIAAANTTILPIDIANVVLAKTVRLHLDLTKTGLSDPSQEDFKTLKDNYIKASGFKTLKDLHKEAKNVEITSKDGEIIINPTVNGGASGPNRGFGPVKNKTINVTDQISNDDLGKLIRAAWENCE